MSSMLQGLNEKICWGSGKHEPPETNTTMQNEETGLCCAFERLRANTTKIKGNKIKITLTP